MKKIICLLFLSSVTFLCKAQNETKPNEDHIKKARTELTPAIQYFYSDCIVNKNCNDCITDLISKAKDDYQNYLIGGLLYDIDPKTSYKLHKSALEKHPNELHFNLEYAIESHRIEDYKTAIKHYKIYKEANVEDYRVNVWLSECYLNIDDYQKAIEHWKLANHSKNHTGIDKAIHIIHGNTEQIKKRSQLINRVKSKDSNSAFELIFLDMNWELDWWNTNIQDYFLEKDLNIIQQVFGVKSKEYLQLSVYNKIKHLSKDYNSTDSIKSILTTSKLIIYNNPLTLNGKVNSDILRISFINKLLDEKTFFTERGQELITLADIHKDEELLNIYAYLEATVNGHVSEDIDKKGWNDYLSERFAISYFIGLADKNTYDNPDLEKAIIDFPKSSKLNWVKLNCAKIEGKPIKTDLIHVIKKEFKTLGSDRNKYSYALKNYFYLLKNEL
jgi:hypothetical protein